jgi:hypothetical protein
MKLFPIGWRCGGFAVHCRWYEEPLDERSMLLRLYGATCPVREANLIR